MLHLRHRQRLLWSNASRVWDPHLTRAQPRQLPVSAATHKPTKRLLPAFHRISGHFSQLSRPPMCRFFLMYLINKDETEHTGQVRVRASTLLLSCSLFASMRQNCVGSILRSSQTLASTPGFYLCNISTHLKCCISAAYLEEEAMRGLPLTFFFFISTCYCPAPETQVVVFFIWCAGSVLMPQTQLKEKRTCSVSFTNSTTL